MSTIKIFDQKGGTFPDLYEPALNTLGFKTSEQLDKDRELAELSKVDSKNIVTILKELDSEKKYTILEDLVVTLETDINTIYTLNVKLYILYTNLHPLKYIHFA